jgi:hypothetical protein
LNAITNFINPRSTIQIHLSGIQYVIVLKNQSRLFHPTSSITLIFFQNDNNALIPHLRPATTAATNSSSPPVRAACQVRAYQDCRCWRGHGEPCVRLWSRSMRRHGADQRALAGRRASDVNCGAQCLGRDVHWAEILQLAGATNSLVIFLLL